MIPITDRDLLLAAELDSMPRHFSASPHSEDCVQLTGDWQIILPTGDEIALCGVDSLRRFLKKYCDLDMSVATDVQPTEKTIEVSWKDDKAESYAIHISQSKIRIIGDSPAGALYATHRLQWMMGENGGPFLPLGDHGFYPAIDERMTATPFHQGFDDAGDPLTYTDEYLDLMAHYGFNGLHFYFDLFDYISESKDYPEFVSSEAAGRLDRLASLSQRAARFNIGIYLHPNAVAQRLDNPVFVNHPELKGAFTWGPEHVCLCSSESGTIKLYAAVMNEMIRRAPGIKGVIAIVGGECLMHCYTRPHPRPKSGTNCPVCSGKAPSEVVAGFVNGIAEGIWAKNPTVSFAMWPYSAHLWSESPEQQELIQLMNPRVGFMTPREKDAWIRKDGVDLSVFDYSISTIGPSQAYMVQREACKKRGIPFYVKNESSVTLELYNLPYIPVMNLWQQRWEGICRDEIRGVLANWRFGGLTGTLSEELGFRETWQSEDEVNTLEVMAKRLAGQAGHHDLLAAWSLFSTAFTDIVLTVGTSGFPYWRGPMYLGPAHPLVLFSEQGLKLPDTFSPVDPVFVEIYKEEELWKAPRRRLFFDDYRWTLPLGVESMLHSYTQANSHWVQGLDRFNLAISKANESLRPTLMKERDVALMVACCLKATLNLARFQIQRERATREPVHNSEVEEIRNRLVEIVEDDLKNAELGYELARSNNLFGYGFVYGKAFDVQMIRDKINFTKNVLLPDIEQFFYIVASHAFARTYGDGGIVQ